MIRHDNKCIFCGLKNKNTLLLNKNSWMSKIQIRYIDNDELLDELSICPECRKKHTIQDLYKMRLLKYR